MERTKLPAITIAPGVTASIGWGRGALVERLFTQDANVRNVRSFFALKRAKFEPSVALSPGPRAA